MNYGIFLIMGNAGFISSTHHKPFGLAPLSGVRLSGEGCRSSARPLGPVEGVPLRAHLGFRV